MTINDLLPRLESVRQRGAGRWVSRCPGHADKSPSLSISEGDKGLLLRCWAGCTVAEICGGLGLSQRDLFYDRRLNPRSQSARLLCPAPQLDRLAVAWRFELAALDLRLRAERIFSEALKVNCERLSHEDLDRALSFVAQGHDDIARAEVFALVADTQRLKSHSERMARHGGPAQAA